jgi:hypothetical protein
MFETSGTNTTIFYILRHRLITSLGVEERNEIILLSGHDSWFHREVAD